MTPTEFLDICLEISFLLVMAGLVCGFLRLAIGPSFADRVVALDMMTISVVAFCALYAIRAGTPVFLDVAIVLALIGFLATVALARYGERSLMQRKTPAPELHQAAIRPAETDPDEEPRR